MARKAKVVAPSQDANALAAALVSALGGVRAPQQQQLVGIRNIAASTVGIPAFGTEGSFSLHPFSELDPNSMAIVSVQRWHQLRKGPLFDQGLIERYDVILGDEMVRAPDDKPIELAPNHDKNRLPNPDDFITSRDETRLRADIMAMTSVNSLHRLLATCDAKVRDLQQKFREEGDPQASQRAKEECPALYQLAEKLAEWRLDQLSPSRSEDLPPARRA